jgi:hypothetical protein
MADHYTKPDITALRKLEACLQHDLMQQEAMPRGRRWQHRDLTPEQLGLTCWQLSLHRFWARWRRASIWAGSVAGVVIVGMMALWLRLGAGPIDVDFATPWLAAAIEENFGSNHRIVVGGTQLERDASGRTALRIRNIIVRDAHGEIVASAPKAEVSFSGSGLMTGRVRANRLSLVGAEMQVRIEPDSKVTVFAGTNRQPFVTASVTEPALRAGVAPAPMVVERAPVPQPAGNATIPDLAALLAWIDGLGTSGLDGRDLSELGLKNGNLTLFDQRNGKQWEFQDINLSLTRPSGGGVALTISSEAAERPWMLRATVSRGDGGTRRVEIETERLPAKELMLALRIGDGQIEPNIPISARIRAQIGADGIPKMIEGRVVLEKGYISDVDEPLSRVEIDRAEATLEWDATRHALVAPFQVVSGANRLTLFAQLTPPRESIASWSLRITGGSILLASSARDPDALVLNRVQLGLRIDPDRQRIDIEQGEIGNMDLGLAISGSLDYAGEARLAIGIAGTRMSVAAMKRLWPSFINPKVHAWVSENILSGTVERVVIATNAPIATFKPISPPIPDDGLAIEISGNGAEIRPIHGLPSIRDADMRVRITGRTASVTVNRGNIEVSPGRRLAISNGLFEVPDHYMSAPASRVRFKIDGSVAAAAELLSSERLRDHAGSPIDPATSRGNVTAYVTMTMPLKTDLPAGSAQYAMNLEVNNFSAEKLVMGQKVEAAALRVRADNQCYALRGHVKVSGIPSVLK